MKTQPITLAIINDVSILMVENGQKLVPVKPICEALNIDFKRQYEKIKEDETLSSTMVLTPTVAADGKIREMASLPLKYVFGWLFTINPKNVKDEAKESVRKYRALCYDVLFSFFSLQINYWEQKQEKTSEYQAIISEKRKNLDIAKKELKEVEIKMKKFESMTFEQWKEENNSDDSDIE